MGRCVCTAKMDDHEQRAQRVSEMSHALVHAYAADSAYNAISRMATLTQIRTFLLELLISCL